ncbi:hypothetical protein PTKIN_Ptkin12aG0161900 [Pterospermum kingtungense]
MWAKSLTSVGVGPYSPTPITKHQPLTHFPINASPNPRLPPRQPAAAANGGSSHKQEEGKEISGSDVLWALQRAAAEKRKAKRKKKGLISSESDASQREKDGIDYSNVRPLEIKTEWRLKLDELEKRLQELEATT